VRSAVANLPALPPLEDALVICLLLLDQEPDCYQRAAVRWPGRLLLEHRGVSLRHAERAGRCTSRSPTGNSSLSRVSGRRWTSPDREVVSSCTLITCQANELAGPIHHRHARRLHGP
jgi:hypothetical protein